MTITTLKILTEWFEAGVQQGARHMLVICDTYDHEDYPVYTKTDAECLARHDNPGEMQRVMEVYDLRMSREEQLQPYQRVHNLPPREIKS